MFYSNWFLKSHFATQKFCQDKEPKDKFIIDMPISFHDLYDSISCQILETEEQWILNLDLDYFYRDNIQILTDEYIVKVAKDIKKAKDGIAVMTIALSPECCGGWDNAFRTYDLIAPILGLEKLNL